MRGKIRDLTIKEIFLKIVQTFLNIVNKEVHSVAGRINLLGTVPYSILIAIYALLRLIPSTLNEIFSFVLLYFKGIEQQTNDANFIILFSIGVLSFFACLVFIGITERVEKKHGLNSESLDPNDKKE